MFQKFLWCIINFIEASFNYIIIWLHISASNFYIVICIELALECIYLGVLRHDLCVNDNLVIHVGCKYHCPYIIGDIVELLLTHCCGLDGTGISSEEQHNRLIHRYVVFFIIFVFFTSKHPCHFYPSFHIPMVYWCDHRYLSISRPCHTSVDYRPFFARLLFHNLFDNRYALFSVLGRFNLFRVLHISGWQFFRQNPAWTTCSLSVSCFVISPHVLL